jgi:pimeloyl-ACP methyl ester carboxylesterase
MTEPTLNYVHCPDAAEGHRMAYWQWGNPSSEHVVLCVHGLTRQGRDFDALAQGLLDKSNGNLRVVCPDVVGRGHSDWLKNAEAYQLPTYAADMLALLAQLRPSTLDWVGTSMGGLIGMAVCGTPDLPLPVTVRRLVLNDVGPALEWKALQRIGEYLGHTGRFTSVQQAADLMWTVSSSFGPHTSKDWLALSKHMVKPMADGSGDLTLHYDPAIAQPFSQMTEASVPGSEAQLWQLYDHIQAKTLLVRGAESDLLSRQTALDMAQRGPKASLIEFVGVGHAPTFVANDQIAAVASFLLE